MVGQRIDAVASVSATTSFSQTIQRAASRNGPAMSDGSRSRCHDCRMGYQTPLHDAASPGSAVTLRHHSEVVLDIEPQISRGGVLPKMSVGSVYNTGSKWCRYVGTDPRLAPSCSAVRLPHPAVVASAPRSIRNSSIFSAPSPVAARSIV
jgi:hypothetical protein